MHPCLQQSGMGTGGVWAATSQCYSGTVQANGWVTTIINRQCAVDHVNNISSRNATAGFANFSACLQPFSYLPTHVLWGCLPTFRFCWQFFLTSFVAAYILCVIRGPDTWLQKKIVLVWCSEAFLPLIVIQGQKLPCSCPYFSLHLHICWCPALSDILTKHFLIVQEGSFSDFDHRAFACELQNLKLGMNKLYGEITEDFTLYEKLVRAEIYRNSEWALP